MTGGIWVIGEAKGEGVVRVSAEAATLARSLAAVAGCEVAGVIAGHAVATAASDLARYVPRVLALELPDAADHVAGAVVAPALAALAERESPSWIILGATSDGRDLAGMMSALLGWGVLTNAGAVTWINGAPRVEMAVLGGRFVTTSEFTGQHGIITIRPNSVAAEVTDGTGIVESIDPPAAATTLPLVDVSESVVQISAEVPIEEASVIVAGGRGIGGPEGAALLQELARVLSGSVGATRPAVDSGWIDYSQQIGQTGKTVKPKLYLALGISGAMQHAVGIQGAETIIAVNRDPEAPIIQFADLFIVGDLFEVGPEILTALRARQN